jgi:hypothetical protein
MSSKSIAGWSWLLTYECGNILLSDLPSKGYVIDSEIAISDVSILVLEQFDSIMTAPYIR